MILPILFLTCAVFITPSLARMSMLEFNQNFEEKCFQKNIEDPYRINGQETPLPNTIENFISLAEKFEAENPSFLLKEELYYFIRNYIFENIHLSTDASGNIDVVPWMPGGIDLTEINKLWEPNENIRDRPQQVNDPFSDAEKCSLYHMISHSIADHPQNSMEVKLPINETDDNSSSTGGFRSKLNTEDYYPQEIGVVAIRGTDMAVSLSRVLVGLYVGLNPNRKRSLTEFNRIIDVNLPDNELPQDRMVDPLYTLTMAEVLMLSNWNVSRSQGLAPDGKWVSTPLDDYRRIDGFCPMVYKLEDATPAYSYSTVRGAADGLILGMAVEFIESKKPNAKLSQILRMYYSRDGISVEQDSEVFHTPRVSFCSRRETIEDFTEALEKQMRLYGYLVAEKFSDIEDNLQRAKNQYDVKEGSIYHINNRELDEYCNRELSLDRPEDLPRQTNLDVFVIMDSAISEDTFKTQQMIVGYLAKYLDLRHTGSRMTILLDKNINNAFLTDKINLKPVVADAYSSSCAACTVGQIVYELSNMERHKTISALDHLLQEKKSNEIKYNGTNGKVVVYFNFQTYDYDNYEINRKLKNFHLNHLDTEVFAGGLDNNILKKFVRDDPTRVFMAADGDEEEVAMWLYRKISEIPALLQYKDCEDGRDESSAVFKNFVSPLALQRWMMPSSYFHSSTFFKVMFKSQNGPIRVCHIQTSTTPELETKYCLDTNTAGTYSIEFTVSNPCIGFNKSTCFPLYFTIMGDRDVYYTRRGLCNDLSDHWCKTLEDIKFQVSHEGVRCNIVESGCLGRGAPPLVILLTLLLSIFLHKSF